MQIFKDVAGYVGDYPGKTEKIDVFDYNGSCPCHICSLSRFFGFPSAGNAYCLRRDAHSADATLLRFSARTEAIRNVQM